ncbi:TIGR03943 family putative permease subunit [Streptomyces sp. YIM S03343]
MKRPLQAALLVLSGLGLLHVSLFTDLYLRYVKPRMLPLLITSGVLLLVLGVAEAWTQWKAGRGRRHADRAGHSHSHGHPIPKVAWLLFLPALSLLFYTPPALGAFTASRQAPKAVVKQEDFDPLPAVSPVPMTLGDFTSRVQQDRKQDVKGRTIQMTGFVTPDKKGGSWYLTRLMLNCCAADAQSVQVRIYKAPVLPANTWVTVTGTWHAGGTLGTSSAPVALDTQTVKRVDRPFNGYTDTLPLTPSR